VEGIRRMTENNPSLNLIILDDAFQHRYVKPKVAIVLTEYQRPYYEDDMVPYGRLRDSKSSINRADIVIATKCPDGIKPIEYRIFEKELNLIPAQSLFFSRYRYGRLRPVFAEQAAKTPALDALTANDAILAITGIANPRPFLRFLKTFNAFVRVNVFPDHHQFTRKDIELIQRRFDEMAGEHKIMVTTEKDAVRLINNPYFPHRLKPYIFYLPVMVTFVDNEPRFNENQRFVERLNKLIKDKNVIKSN
jgi:tetraacyldisaccharide 4'-kinase